MSAASLDRQALRPRQVKLTNTQREAIVAACAVGTPKVHIAKQFGVRPETISRMLRKVKMLQVDSNPLAKGYKPDMKTRAVKAINRGLDCKRDPYKAANIGVKVLEGIGEFSSHAQVDEHREITIRWAGFDDILTSSETPAIDVTPTTAIVDTPTSSE